MSTEDPTEGLLGQPPTEEHSFDELAAGLADGTLTRARALKLAGAAFLSGVFGILSLPKDADARRHRRRRRLVLPPSPPSPPPPPPCIGASQAQCQLCCTGQNCGCVQTSESTWACSPGITGLCGATPCTLGTPCADGRPCQEIAGVARCGCTASSQCGANAICLGGGGCSPLCGNTCSL